HVIISGDTLWQQISYNVGPGSHELQWRYSKNSSDVDPIGKDRGWVDQVFFGTSQPTNDPGVVDPPVILIQPVGKTVEDGDLVNISVTAASSHPLTYRWFFNGTNMLVDTVRFTGTTNAQLTILGASPAQAGDYSVIVSNAGGWIPSASARLTVNPSIDLAEAIDTLELFVTTDGDAPWTGHSVVTHDGSDAARNGIVDHGQFSAMRTMVIGPGLLGFWWKVSSETNDVLTFALDAAPQATISGEVVEWRQRLVRIEDGAHFLDWIYNKDASDTSGADRAWVDQLTFLPDGAVEASPPPIGAMTPRISVSETKARLTWIGRTDKTYKVFYKDDISDTDWTAIDDDVSVTWRFIDGNPVTDSITATFEEALAGRTRFYRVLEY
ncbi:MAG TPA: immunoglobulin domain-containing protein, partial [Candidatus Acidoferrum sp.]|nr:immunoglobulin domain-containing protein [Candidatus Acidoferrum sp.]